VVHSDPDLILHNSSVLIDKEPKKQQAGFLLLAANDLVLQCIFLEKVITYAFSPGSEAITVSSPCNVHFLIGLGRIQLVPIFNS
jgi:hypothetical protein